MRVTILGGGFAGLACAAALPARRFDVTLLDRRSHFEFLPNIHELLSGVKSPQSLRLPLAELSERQGHRFLRARVEGIDPDQCKLRLESGGEISHEALVVAIGGVDATFGVEGVERHAMPFKSVRQCARIGARLEALADRRTSARVVIVGGGLEGVEALGEILRGFRHTGLSVTLVEAKERLMPEAPRAIDRYLRRLCRSYPVKILCGESVRRISSKSVRLAGGATLPSDLTIWTGGPAPPPLLADSGLAPAGGWAKVDSCLRSRHCESVFIAGDAAEMDTALSRQAYHGLDMGRCAAGNVDRISRGLEPVPFRSAEKPTLVSFGDLSCLLIAGPVVVAGPVLGVAKEAVYQLVMAQLDTLHPARRLLHVLRRGNQAGRELLWPTATSMASLLRLGRLELLQGA